MAQSARNEAEKVTNEAANNVSELGKRTAEVTRETVDLAAEVERAMAHRSAAGVAEVGQAFAELATAQTRNNIEAFRALSQTVDWQAVTRIQSELVRANLEQAANFSRRYVEVAQAIMGAAMSVTEEQAHKKAA